MSLASVRTYIDEDSHQAEMLVARWGETTWRTAGGPERFVRNCFAIPKPERIPVLVNHSGRPVARVRHFLHGEEDLKAQIRFYDTDAGWFDGWCRAQAGEFTGASVSFRPMAERTVAGVREIVVAELLHLSLVTADMTPAYKAPGLVELHEPRAEATERLLAIKYPPDIAKCPDPWEREAVYKKLLAEC